ncbi:MAG: beta-phosphoglucomutase [Flavobacteriaceae bacterium]|nr:MAG: beta-phosphoglucomutase [Flavobacteriaceae bacterium]
MKEKAFIFDLDGVIVDTAKYHFLAWKNLANELGFDFTETQNELLKGVSRVKSLEIILNIGGVTLSEEKTQAFLVKKNTEYLAFINKMTADEILPGVLKVLAFLKNNNIPFALGSASKNARFILEQVGIIDLFDAIVDGNDVSKAKPDPEVFLLGAEKLNVAPANCVVFEDAIAGVEAANNAGMVSIGIGSEDVLTEASSVFESMDQMSDAFLNNLIK